MDFKHPVFPAVMLLAGGLVLGGYLFATGGRNPASPAPKQPAASREPAEDRDSSVEAQAPRFDPSATSFQAEDAGPPRANTAAVFIEEQLARGRKPNRLIDEKSPYLLQHAFNPVDWHPWGEEAFEKARSEEKPIFVSIGYSTCHWCHVMEREVFSNPDIADMMNRWFVNIKVDREERPDVDRVYMSAVQAMTGSGGWPMSVFITHDLKPFYAGTYFPPESRFGRPGFPDLLQALHQAWQNDRDKIHQAANQITDHLQRVTRPQRTVDALAETVLPTAYNQIAGSYDATDGGFGPAPKFPRPATFNFLLRYYHRAGEKQARDMTLHTLRRMAAGGIHDHIGGGFHRYSTDHQWRVPHFEKMLYDQAQLAISYLEAYQITGDDFFAGVARDILDYVRRDMTGASGAFYSAEDADSALPENPEEHGEGAFYLWTRAEIERILGAEQAAVFAYRYGVQEDGNAPSDPSGEFTGKNILYTAYSLKETAQKFGRPTGEVRGVLEEARRALFQTRSARPRPYLDDKVITSWNGLMISAFARGYQALGDTLYRNAAEDAARFIMTRLYDPETQTLLRRYRAGEAGLEAHLDDYAFLTQGLLDLYETSLDVDWLAYAHTLTQKQIARFWDAEGSGFYDTSGRDKTVLVRMKESYDGAEPTGNSIAALNLLRLAQMTDNNDWHEKGVHTIMTFANRLRQQPAAMPQMLVAFDFQVDKPKQIIIAGTPGAADTKSMLQAVYTRFLPNKIIMLADGSRGQQRLARYLPFISSLNKLDGKATAYVCENYVCQLPTSDVAVMTGLLTD